MWRTLPLALLTLTIASCGGDGGKDATDDTANGGDDGTGAGDGGGDGASGGSDGGCPDEVPEQYRALWDCEASNCDGWMVYHAGTGTSEESGSITTTEQWFVFQGGGEYCVDEFTIAGQSSAYDPATFNCSQCEEVYQIQWVLSSGNACGINWGYTFIEDEDSPDGPFDGFLMFDTHNSFGDRNPDDAMLVVTAMLDASGSAFYPNPDYGRGTATPTGSNDGPPESYEWANGGSCWQTGRSTAHMTPTPVDDLREKLPTSVVVAP